MRPNLLNQIVLTTIAGFVWLAAGMRWSRIGFRRVLGAHAVLQEGAAIGRRCASAQGNTIITLFTSTLSGMAFIWA